MCDPVRGSSQLRSRTNPLAAWRSSELLAFLEPIQRFARLAELRQHPGGGGDRSGKQEDDVPAPDGRDLVLNQ